MTFDSIHNLLKWFANREFLRPPRKPGNHDYTSIGGGRQESDPVDIFATFSVIARVLVEELPRRDYLIVTELYVREGPTYRELGRRLRCSRWTIWRVKGRIIDQLEKRFEEEGLITNRYEPPKFMVEVDRGGNH